jgi:DNA replicative helicase MCM subunit Mcm2 (Cdc46/Mcm family)
MCPNGGPQLDWTNEVVQLHKAIQFARSVGYVPLTKAAHKMWSRMYVEIENEVGELPALPQAMCARGVAHVRRLALIFALLDIKDAVDSEHLQAAKKLWDYCMDSARFIFSGETKEQLQIINWMRRNPGMVTVRKVTDEVFHRNRKVEWVKIQMDGLVKVGRLSVHEDQYSIKE